MKYYIAPVFGCVEPESLIGPFQTFENMLKRAKKVHAEQDEEDALFWLRIGEGKPLFESFCNADLELDTE